jgi:hypothetical protein
VLLFNIGVTILSVRMKVRVEKYVDTEYICHKRIWSYILYSYLNSPCCMLCSYRIQLKYSSLLKKTLGTKICLEFLLGCYVEYTDKHSLKSEEDIWGGCLNESVYNKYTTFELWIFRVNRCCSRMNLLSNVAEDSS